MGCKKRDYPLDGIIQLKWYIFVFLVFFCRVSLRIEIKLLYCFHTSRCLTIWMISCSSRIWALITSRVRMCYQSMWQNLKILMILVVLVSSGEFHVLLRCEYACHVDGLVKVYFMSLQWWHQSSGVQYSCHQAGTWISWNTLSFFPQQSQFTRDWSNGISFNSTLYCFYNSIVYSDIGISIINFSSQIHDMDLSQIKREVQEDGECKISAEQLCMDEVLNTPIYEKLNSLQNLFTKYTGIAKRGGFHVMASEPMLIVQCPGCCVEYRGLSNRMLRLINHIRMAHDHRYIKRYTNQIEKRYRSLIELAKRRLEGWHMSNLHKWNYSLTSFISLIELFPPKFLYSKQFCLLLAF